MTGSYKTKAKRNITKHFIELVKLFLTRVRVNDFETTMHMYGIEQIRKWMVSGVDRFCWSRRLEMCKEREVRMNHVGLD